MATDTLSRTVSELLQLTVQILDILRFLKPFGVGGGLRTTYDDHFGLIGKRVVDFLLMLIELFSLGYGWVATSENRSKIGDFAQCGQFNTNFQVEGVAPHHSMQRSKKSVDGYS